MKMNYILLIINAQKNYQNYPIIIKKIKRFFNVIFINYLQFITYVRQKHTLWNIKNIKLRRVKVSHYRFFKLKIRIRVAHLMSERSANYWIMQCGEHLLQIHAKERTRKRIVISKLYANFKQFFFLRSKDRRPPTTHENRQII